MPANGRINHPALARKVMPADAAAAMIGPGATVGMSGFTGAGYPKEVPLALAQRIVEMNASGTRFRINVWTGASTAPELDGALATADGIELRLPYQSDPVSRQKARPLSTAGHDRRFAPGLRAAALGTIPQRPRMRAGQITRFGGPEVLDTVDIPEPEAGQG